MRLSESELREVDGFLRGQRALPEPGILDRIELGIWIFPPLPFAMMNIFGPDFPIRVLDESPLFLVGRFGILHSQQLLMLFRAKGIPYLMVRVDSWQAYINCNGEIMSDHCAEDLDEIRKTIERLRKRCGEKHPSVAIP